MTRPRDLICRLCKDMCDSPFPEAPQERVYPTRDQWSPVGQTVFNKYNITLVFSVLALLFCLSGFIWPPQQNTRANTENTG